jgi:small ligand-binding sensory domain FIST
MSLITSTDFASASANGTDWRDTSKAVLEQLDSIRTEDDGFNFGFLYISDYLADDATSIYNLFKSVLKIDNWIGSIGMGVIGEQDVLVDQPAISAMIGRFPEGSFCVFPKAKPDSDIKLIDTTEDQQAINIDPLEEDLERQGPRFLSEDVVQQWLIENTPTLGIVHIDPLSPHSPLEFLSDLEHSTDCFFVGGMTSSRSHHFQIANGVNSNSLCGAFFSDNVPVATVLSQGCSPIGEPHIITKLDNSVIIELNDKRALDVLQNDLRKLAGKKTGKSLQKLNEPFEIIESSDKIPPEFKSLFRGQIHVALSLNQSDQNDFLVRNIAGIDVNEGSIELTEDIQAGQRIFFVERDENNISSDLSKALITLRNRVMSERGCFEPKGALYISCIARGFAEDKNIALEEIDLIRKIIGDIPLCGFYAGGEINNARFYSYAGVITLFF